MTRATTHTTCKFTSPLGVTVVAARAWAAEKGDYELTVKAAETYILARRKTTELIVPHIKHGGLRQGINDDTLADFNLTKLHRHPWQ